MQALQGLVFLLFTVIDEKGAEQTVGVVIQSSFSLSVYCPAIVSLTHSIDLERGSLVLCHSDLLLGERINDPRKRKGRKEGKKTPSKPRRLTGDPSGFRLTPEHHLSLCSSIYLVCSK